MMWLDRLSDINWMSSQVVMAFIRLYLFPLNLAETVYMLDKNRLNHSVIPHDFYCRIRLAALHRLTGSNDARSEKSRHH